MAGGRKIEFNQPVAVAVEGADYFHLLRNCIAEPEFSDVQLFDFENLPGTGNLAAQTRSGPNANLARWLEIFKANHKGVAQALGIIRDAEDDAAAMTASVSNVLHRAGLPTPARSFEIQAGNPATAFLLIPHTADTGCLEYALLDAVNPRYGALKKCAEQYLVCVDNADRNDRWRAKVRTHAIIASSDNPQATLGESVRMGLWDFSHPGLRVMLDFIKKLQEAAQLHETP